MTKKEIKRDARKTLKMLAKCEVELSRCCKKAWRATFIGRATKVQDIRRLMNVRDQMTQLRTDCEERLRL